MTDDQLAEQLHWRELRLEWLDVKADQVETWLSAGVAVVNTMKRL